MGEPRVKQEKAEGKAPAEMQVLQQNMMSLAENIAKHANEHGRLRGYFVTEKDGHVIGVAVRLPGRTNAFYHDFLTGESREVPLNIGKRVVATNASEPFIKYSLRGAEFKDAKYGKEVWITGGKEAERRIKELGEGYYLLSTRIRSHGEFGKDVYFQFPKGGIGYSEGMR